MLRAKKSLGQHFLHDANVLRKIVAFIDPAPGDTIIEIGPGTGALTRMLAGRCRLLCVEIDGRALQQLRDEFGDSAEVFHGDIREMEPQTIAGADRVRIAGNIPYNITSDILLWVFTHRRDITDATIMMQAEVAERLVARPRTKAYGILSVFTQVYGTARKAFNVSRRCFTPPPDVDSTVMYLKPGPGPEDKLDESFRRLVRGLFGKRRKTIRNGLRYMGFHEEALRLADQYLDKRPEELEPPEFVTMARLLTEQMDLIPHSHH